MSFNFVPYRATALWNEAVTIFREGLTLKEHRHRLHKHKNCFSGKEAVSFLRGALINNKLFHPDISRDQVRQLLNHFLKANFVAPVKNCSISRQSGHFFDSCRHLYEFTDHLYAFQPNTPRFSATHSKTHNHQESRKLETVKECSKEIEYIAWKKVIIESIIESLDPLDLSQIIPLNVVDPAWVYINATSKIPKLKWNTELPKWILSAIQNLLSCTDHCKAKKTYPNFEADVFKVVHEYFDTLESPIIPYEFFELFIQVYLYLDYLSSLDKHSMNRISSSKENLVMELSSPVKACTIPRKVAVQKELLPPYSCLETAFTSDNPTTRIVPQSSVETLHLTKSTVSVFNDRMYNPNYPLKKAKSMHLCASPKKNKYETTYGHERRPFNQVNYNNNHALPAFHAEKDYECNTHGFVNKAFSYSPPVYSNLVSMQENRGNFNRSFKRKWDKKLSMAKSCESVNNSHGAYDNEGLTFSMEDLRNEEVDYWDFSLAMATIKKLTQISKQSESSLSDCEESSFYTAVTSSLSSSADTLKSELSLNSLAPESKSEWSHQVLMTGVHIYQLLIFLIPPSNRARLKYLLQLIYDVPKKTNVEYLSYSYVTKKLRKHILRPYNDDSTVDPEDIQKVIKFLSNNLNEIFLDADEEIVSSVDKKILELQKQPQTFCERISSSEFERQRYQKSALLKLIDQILNDPNLSSKEKKKKLRQFKESHPNIYKIKFPDKEPSLKKMNFGSLRL